MRPRKYFSLCCLPAFAALALTVRAAGDGFTERKDFKTLELSNGTVKVLIIPEAAGRISFLAFPPDGGNLLEPYSEDILTVSPLVPPFVRGNWGGFKEFFRGVTPVQNWPFSVVSQSAGAVTLETDNYLGLQVKVKKSFSLAASASRADIRTECRNTDSKSLKIRLWPHLMARLSENGDDTVVMPVRAVTKDRKSEFGPLMIIPRDSLCELRESCSETLAVPARPWIGKVDPVSGVALALSFSPENLSDWTLCCWAGKAGGSYIRSLELTAPALELRPGESVALNTALSVFKGLKGLREICGDIAIDCSEPVVSDGAASAELTLASCAISGADELLLRLSPAEPAGADSSGSSASVKTPLLAPGKVFSAAVKIPLDGRRPGLYRISGEFRSNGDKFTLLSPVLTVQ
jgi:hypothetical protein